LKAVCGDGTRVVETSAQQPDGGDTPGVAEAPVALAGAIIVGLARPIEMVSLQAAVFGVGMTVGAGLILVSVVSRLAVGDWRAPGGGATRTSGVAGGRAAALISAFPGAEAHEPPGAQFPGEDPDVTVPVVLPPIEPRISTGMAGARSVGAVALELWGTIVEPGIGLAPTGLIAVVGLAETLVLVVVTLSTDGEISFPAGEQFILVPGIVGSCANGGVAKVVAGAPGTVAAEKRLVNGLGPVKGDDTIAPGVVGSPIAVVPIVDI
jgi:hypothetical protein